MGRKRARKTTKARERQDARPFPHQNGLWAKKCRGRFIYLGSVAADPTGEKAWARWLDERDDWRAGRVPTKLKGGLTLGGLANKFLTSKQRRMEAGELSPLTFKTVKCYIDLLVGTLGASRRVDDLRPSDFAPVRSAMAARWGPTRLKIAMTAVRSLFKWGWENELIDRPIRFGSEFAPPPARLIREARNGKGPRMFKAAEIRALLDVAEPFEKCLILLAINTAMGRTDLGDVETAAFDLQGGWLEWARRKTGVPRRIPLWDETVAAVQAWIDVRPPAKPGAGKYLLRTKYRRHMGPSSIWMRYKNLAEQAGVEGREMYDFRRTFATVGEDARDPAALSSIMGHTPSGDDMASVYRQRIDDTRLRAVADAVRDWLFSTMAKR